MSFLTSARNFRKRQVQSQVQRQHRPRLPGRSYGNGNDHIANGMYHDGNIHEHHEEVHTSTRRVTRRQKRRVRMRILLQKRTCARVRFTAMAMAVVIVFISISGNRNGDATKKSSSSWSLDMQSKLISKEELRHARHALYQAKQHLHYNMDMNMNMNLGMNANANTNTNTPTRTRTHMTGPKPLRPMDRMKYTVRINTWRRNEQLLASVHHLRTCPNIAQIQVIWCDVENDPPPELLSLVGIGTVEEEEKNSDPDIDPDIDIDTARIVPTPIATTTATEMHVPEVVVEYHTINSLNERFRILIHPPTYGILSIDDDVVRPCLAMDAGFYKWTDHYDRMVGYDPRLHLVTEIEADAEAEAEAEVDAMVVNPNRVQEGDETEQEHDHGHDPANLGGRSAKPAPDTATTSTTVTKSRSRWSYGYLSHAQHRNRYSLTLPRFCFLHVQYLQLYMQYAPPRILQTIDTRFNCEDIGLSFFVSALTGMRTKIRARTSGDGHGHGYQHGHGHGHGDKSHDSAVTVPLLADRWAISSMVKLYSEQGGISDTKDHKRIRDECVDTFGYLLGLKDGYRDLNDDEEYGHGYEYEWGMLHPSPILRNGAKGAVFGVGADVPPYSPHHDNPLRVEDDYVPSRKEMLKEIKSWMARKGNHGHEHDGDEQSKSKSNKARNGFLEIKRELQRKMRLLGLIEGSAEWKKRWGKEKKHM